MSREKSLQGVVCTGGISTQPNPGPSVHVFEELACHVLGSGDSQALRRFLKRKGKSKSKSKSMSLVT